MRSQPRPGTWLFRNACFHRAGRSAAGQQLVGATVEGLGLPSMRRCCVPGRAAVPPAWGDILGRRPRGRPVATSSGGANESPFNVDISRRRSLAVAAARNCISARRKRRLRRRPPWPASTPRRNRDRGRARRQRHRTRRCGGPANIEMEVLPAALRSWRHPLVTAAPRHARRRSATGARAMSPRAVGTPPSRSTRIVPSLSATRPCATNLARSRLTLRSPGY
jgi:hypothetical protein